MSVPSTTEISELGFSFEMFGLTDNSAFIQMLKRMLIEHGALISGRIGSSAYASTSEPTSTYVKRAIKCLVAAELCQRRINRLGQEVKLEDGSDAKKMRQNRVDYLAEAELMISKIETGEGASNDFSFSVTTSSHFGDS